jgi:flagellar hook-basal body complex protein FliE
MSEEFLSSSFITPLKPMNIGLGTQSVASGNTGEVPFADVLSGLIQNVEETDSIEQAASVAAASGDVDALHNLTIASVKAELALQLFVQLRNKGLDAYQEIMRTGL